MKNSFVKFLGATLLGLIGTCFLGVGVIFIQGFLEIAETHPSLWIWAPLIVIFFYFVAYSVYEDIIKDKDQTITRITKEGEEKLNALNQEAKIKINELNRQKTIAESEADTWKKSLREKSSGFPTLFENISYLEKLIDDALSSSLANKNHPALRASEVIKEEAKRRREAEKKFKMTNSIIEFYEELAPFLLDYKNEEFGEIDDALLAEYTEEEKQDPVVNYLTKEEYRSLSTTERNQMALDRFWKRPKSKWFIGILYERYVGYLYESAGYDVEYTGIKEGKSDLGRDLICRKGKDIVVVQCKNWSRFKTVFENNIFQFFGTVFKYRDDNKGKNVKAVFYCTTELSPLAKRFAGELDIELKERFRFDTSYPCIKCNISKVDGTKIYHLPFDQQYDTTKIEPNKGEFYAASVSEAEKKGFRRAWRWRGVAN